MAKDWASDVKKYAPDANDGVIGGIVRYCGIALQKVDSSLVSFSDPVELARVRNNFLKKKCGLTDSDEVLDAAIAEVGERMKADRTKNRVTVYYLLSDRFGMHGLFVKAAKATAAKAAPVAAAAAGLALVGDAAPPVAAAAHTDDTRVSGAGVAAGLAGAAAAGTAAAVGLAGSGVSAFKGTADAGVDAVKGAAGTIGDAAMGVGGAAVAGAGAAVAGLTSAVGGAASGLGLNSDSGGKKGSLAWLWWLLLALGILALLWWLFMHKPSATPLAAPITTSAPDTNATATATGMENAATTAATPVAAPNGAGVVSEVRDGKPLVKVYFDTGKAEVVPAFAPATDALRTYLTAHPGSKLGVSGFNDPTGNARANAVLSQRRAEAVRTTSIEAGVPEASIELVKPAASTDAAVNLAEARRVEVFVQ
jgi:outer membrane protein OmpA-like peptidoglycan-associated protein